MHGSRGRRDGVIAGCELDRVSVVLAPEHFQDRPVRVLLEALQLPVDAGVHENPQPLRVKVELVLELVQERGNRADLADQFGALPVRVDEQLATGFLTAYSRQVEQYLAGTDVETGLDGLEHRGDA